MSRSRERTKRHRLCGKPSPIKLHGPTRWISTVRDHPLKKEQVQTRQLIEVDDEPVKRLFYII